MDRTSGYAYKRRQHFESGWYILKAQAIPLVAPCRWFWGMGWLVQEAMKEFENLTCELIWNNDQSRIWDLIFFPRSWKKENSWKLSSVTFCFWHYCNVTRKALWKCVQPFMLQSNSEQAQSTRREHSPHLLREPSSAGGHLFTYMAQGNCCLHNEGLALCWWPLGH